MLIFKERSIDTICAISTPHGVGGISIIRISGSCSLQLTRKIATFLPTILESHKVYLGKLYDGNSYIDEVLVTFFKEGSSFTGEEVIEISCHGSPIICQNIIKLLIESGARLAGNGEFTYRAFLNNRLDLAQAEGVLGLIQSNSVQAAKISLRQLEGQLSNTLNNFEDTLIWMLAQLEASIDFSSEGIDFLPIETVLIKLSQLEFDMNSLLKSYKKGRIIQDGFRISIIGQPNVGKSSLFNLLTENAHSIVTHIPGTTRDVIRAETSYDQFKITFIDTAGIRDNPSDIVEQMGIVKSKEVAVASDYIFFVLDSTQPITNEIRNILKEYNSVSSCIIFNKCDLIQDKNLLHSLETDEGFSNRVMHFISCLDLNSRDKLLSFVTQSVVNLHLNSEAILSNARHFDCLSTAYKHLLCAKDVLTSGVGSEFVVIDLKFALQSIQEILGKHFNDQILDRVFKEFCIGK